MRALRSRQSWVMHSTVPGDFTHNYSFSIQLSHAAHTLSRGSIHYIEPARSAGSVYKNGEAWLPIPTYLSGLARAVYDEVCAFRPPTGPLLQPARKLLHFSREPRHYPIPHTHPLPLPFPSTRITPYMTLATTWALCTLTAGITPTRILLITGSCSATATMRTPSLSNSRL